MKITVYLKNGAFVTGDIQYWEYIKQNLDEISLVYLTNPQSIIVSSEITHIIEQPNKT